MNSATNHFIYLNPSKKTYNKLFFFDYNDFRTFEVFKWKAVCIFKCETTKMKLAKNMDKNWFLSKTFVVLCNYF